MKKANARSGRSSAEIARMVQFSQLFPDETLVVTLSQQLSWSHFHALLPIKDPLARDFYAGMCRLERWDVRTLRQKHECIRRPVPGDRPACRGPCGTFRREGLLAEIVGGGQ